MSIIELVLQGLVSLAFTANGVLKLLNVGPSVGHFAHFGYPRWFLVLAGVAELIAGVGMLIGFWVPGLVLLAALWLIAIMLGALYTHFVRVKDPIKEAMPALIVLILALAIVGLKL